MSKMNHIQRPAYASLRESRLIMFAPNVEQMNAARITFNVAHAQATALKDAGLTANRQQEDGLVSVEGAIEDQKKLRAQFTDLVDHLGGSDADRLQHSRFLIRELAAQVENKSGLLIENQDGSPDIVHRYPLEFGFNGEVLLVISGGMENVQNALLFVDSKVAANTNQADRQGDNNEPVRTKTSAARAWVEQKASSDVPAPSKRETDVGRWSVIQQALVKFQKSLASANTFEQQMSESGDPAKMLLEIHPIALANYATQNPQRFTQVLRDCLRSNPQEISTAYEKLALPQLSPAMWVEVIKEAAGIPDSAGNTLPNPNPLALRFLPEKEKKGTDNFRTYRELVLVTASIDGDVLLGAAAEYDKVWKADSEGYKVLCVAALDQKPELFFRQGEWLLHLGSAGLQEIMNDVSEETKVRIIEQISGERGLNVGAFRFVEGSYQKFIQDVITRSEQNDSVLRRALGAVCKNQALFMEVKKDNELYTHVRNQLCTISVDMVVLRSQYPWVFQDEDLGRKIIEDLARDSTHYRNIGSQLQLIPSRVWESARADSSFNTKVIAVFKAEDGGEDRGPLFAYAPQWMKEDKTFAGPIVSNSATAYKYCDVTLRNDPEMLYRALLSQQKKLGNMHWEDVPVRLQSELKNAGFVGVMDTPEAQMNLLRVLVLKLPPVPTVATNENVQSGMGVWTDDMQKDEKLVQAYLKQNILKHPEFYVEVRDDHTAKFDFARDMITLNPLVLRHVTSAYHIQFEGEEDKQAYRALVVNCLKLKPDLFVCLPEELRGNANFVAEMIAGTRNLNLLQDIPEAKKVDTVFLVSLMQEMIRWNFARAKILESLNTLFPEDVLTKVLMDENGAMLIELLQTDISLVDKVPRSSLEGDILDRVILRLTDMKDRDSTLRVLRRCLSSAREEYIDLHPNLLDELFRTDPTGITWLLSQHQLTVETLDRLVEGYSNANIQKLFQEVLPVKSQVLAGLLLRRPYILETLDDRTRSKLVTLLDGVALDPLIQAWEKKETMRLAEANVSLWEDLKSANAEVSHLISMVGESTLITWGSTCKPAKEFAASILQKHIALPAEASIAQLSGQLKIVEHFIVLLMRAVPSAKITLPSMREKTNLNNDELETAHEIDVFRMVLATMEAQLHLCPANNKKALQDKIQAMQNILMNDTSLLSDELLAFNVEANNKSETALRVFVKSAEKGLPSLYRCQRIAGASEHNLAQRVLAEEVWSRNCNALWKKIDEAKKAIVKLRMPESISQNEALYNLDPDSRVFIKSFKKYLDPLSEKFESNFADALLRIGPRNAQMISQEYGAMLKTPKDWQALEAVITADDTTMSKLLGEIVDNIGALTNYILLSKEKHAAKIIDCIRKNAPGITLNEAGISGINADILNFDSLAERSMIILCSRAMGETFDATKLQETWTEIRQRQLDLFNSKEAIAEAKKPQKLFVIAQDDGEEWFIHSEVQKSHQLAAALNAGKAGNVPPAEVHMVTNIAQFNAALAAFHVAKMNNDNSNKHMVLQVLVHGRRVAGNTLNIDIGKVASNAAMKNATLLYTSCYAGNHVERMYDTTFAEATGEVYTDAGGTSAFMNTRESMKYRLADAYNTEIPMEPGEPDRQGKCPGDLNRDGTVTRAEAMSWLDRHSSLHDGHGYIAGKQVF